MAMFISSICSRSTAGRGRQAGGQTDGGAKRQGGVGRAEGPGGQKVGGETLAFPPRGPEGKLTNEDEDLVVGVAQ